MTEKTRTRAKPGERAHVSGEYVVVGRGGKAVASRFVGKGNVLPPTPKRGQSYRLKREVTAKYTTVASAAAMDETTATFSMALARLAKK